jgi:hypothetical protein
MHEMYPQSSSKIAVKRHELAPSQQAAFDAFGKAVFAEATYRLKRSRSSPWPSPMSLNAPTASVGTPGGVARWRDATGIDGSNLGGSRNAGGRLLCPLDLMIAEAEESTERSATQR